HPWSSVRDAGGAASKRRTGGAVGRCTGWAREAGAPSGEEAQSLGPQSDRAEKPPLVKKADSGAGRRQRQPAPDRAAPPVAGLAARMAAARLLGAVIEAKTSLDGLTDATHGHPQYRALDPRD